MNLFDLGGLGLDFLDNAPLRITWKVSCIFYGQTRFLLNRKTYSLWF